MHWIWVDKQSVEVDWPGFVGELRTLFEFSWTGLAPE